jgi:hypothetical protein
LCRTAPPGWCFAHSPKLSEQNERAAFLWRHGGKLRLVDVLETQVPAGKENINLAETTTAFPILEGSEYDNRQVTWVHTMHTLPCHINSCFYQVVGDALRISPCSLLHVLVAWARLRHAICKPGTTSSIVMPCKGGVRMKGTTCSAFPRVRCTLSELAECWLSEQP